MKNWQDKKKERLAYLLRAFAGFEDKVMVTGKREKQEMHLLARSVLTAKILGAKTVLAPTQ